MTRFVINETPWGTIDVSLKYINGWIILFFDHIAVLRLNQFSGIEEKSSLQIFDLVDVDSLYLKERGVKIDFFNDGDNERCVLNVETVDRKVLWD